MAATIHTNMNRRKLEIDTIRICEEILSLSLPWALRSSGIIMGGVVIVYGCKVKLPYDDVYPLLLEVNNAWKVRPVVDHTVPPKGKTQAKFVAVTLSESQNIDSGDADQSIDCSGEQFEISYGVPAKCSYCSRCSYCHASRQHFPLSDIEVDEETQFFPSQEQKRTIPAHSPPSEMQPQNDGISERHQEKYSSQSSLDQRDTEMESHHNLPKRGRVRKRGKKRPPFIMDDEQTLTRSNLYQSWLQRTTEIWTRRPKIGEHVSPKPTKKSKLLQIPPVALSCGLLGRNRATITDDPFDSFQAVAGPYNSFERFDAVTFDAVTLSENPHIDYGGVDQSGEHLAMGFQQIAHIAMPTGGLIHARWPCLSLPTSEGAATFHRHEWGVHGSKTMYSCSDYFDRGLSWYEEIGVDRLEGFLTNIFDDAPDEYKRVGKFFGKRWKGVQVEYLHTELQERLGFSPMLECHWSTTYSNFMFLYQMWFPIVCSRDDGIETTIDYDFANSDWKIGVFGERDIAYY